MFGPEYYAKAKPGNALRRLRIAAGFTLRELAEVCGVTRQAISDAELRERFSPENHQRVLDAITILKAEAVRCGK